MTASATAPDPARRLPAAPTGFIDITHRDSVRAVAIIRAHVEFLRERVASWELGR